MFYFMSFLTLVLLIVTTANHFHGRSPRSYEMLDGRIVNGTNTTIEKHPYQMSLQLYDTHLCGGALIKPDVIVTAAHCILQNITGYYARGGSSTRGKGGQLIGVTKNCIHPQFSDDDNKDYDVAVLKLEKPFELGETVQPIALLDAGKEIPTETIATGTGWATLIFEGEQTEVLQKVEIPKVEQSKCKEIYNFFTERMTCYGYPDVEKGSCQGDSGAPLVVDEKLVGFVSGGYYCAAQMSPGVYTSLENLEIRQHIDNCLAQYN